MRIDILCSDAHHPVNDWLAQWKTEHDSAHVVHLVHRSDELSGGDFLFLISCHEIVTHRVREMYRYALVLHASALPLGRGMSPHVWQIIENKNILTMTLLDAVDEIDAGAIWHQKKIILEGHELYDEINAAIFGAEMELMSWALEHCDISRPRPQVGEPTVYRKRTPDDSRIDPELNISSQFDILRVADPDRYPAFFDLRGHRYKVIIEKI